MMALLSLYVFEKVMFMPESVWIVGAGFSRHAGGPLMYDLFSESADVFLESPDEHSLKAMKHVGSIFRKYLAKNHNGQTYWQNAEDFLEKLDSLIARKTQHFVLTQLMQDMYEAGVQSADELRRIAFCRMCKEVQDYITQTPPCSERLIPYMHWVKHLHESDTVITFNYDTLIETVAKYASVSMEVPLPTDRINENRLNLIKLHGSVSWSLNSSKIPEVRESFNETFLDLPAVHKNPCSPLIATPGASKGRFMSDFAEQWHYAREAIKSALAIHIVGYRFPESDSAAALNLLLPMRESRSGCTVHIVLGTDVLKPETVRLETLVDRNLLGDPKSVIVHPMYAQDYLLLDNEWKEHRKIPYALF